MAQAVGRSFAKLQAELQLILDGVSAAVYGVDERNNLTFCNEALSCMTGYRGDELLGKNVHDAIHHRRPDGTPYPKEECVLHSAIENRQAIHVMREVIWRKDGTSFPAECRVHPVQHPNTGAVSVVTMRELTERERGIETLQTSGRITGTDAGGTVLQDSEEKFRRILSSVADVAWTADRNGRTIYISPKVETVLGYTKQDFRASGSTLRLGVIHPSDFGRVHQSYLALFDKQKPFDEEYRIRRKDGSWIWVHDRATGVHEENGVLYADGSFSDISSRKKAEDDLRWKTAFLEAQTNSTMDGTAVVDPAGFIIYVNQKFVELFPEMATIIAERREHGLLQYALTVVKDPERFRANADYLNQHPTEIRRAEFELLRGVILDIYSAPVIDDDGRYYGRIWTVRDITEQKRAEQKLRRSEAYLAESQRLSHVGSWAWKTDQREYSFWTNEHFRIFGKEPAGDGMIRFEDSLADIHPDDLPHFRQVIRESMEQKKDWEADARIIRPDGTVRNIHGIGHPLLNEAGALVEMLGLSQDVTDRKRNEEMLRQLSLAVEQSPACVVITDPAGNISYVNRKFTETTGYEAEEVLGKNPRLLNARVSPPELFRDLWATITAGREWRGELCNRKKNGEIYWESARIRPITSAKGAITHYLALKEDISERRELECQLRQAQKLEGIGQLAAGIAHEINTPTQFVTDNLTFLRDSWNAIHELLDLYRNAVQDPATTLSSENLAALEEATRRCDLEFIVTEVPHAIDQSLDGARRVAAIVHAMKEFSHPDSADKTATDLNKAIMSTITVARNEWKYVADVVTLLDGNLANVVCFPGEVNQVILNLLVNAAHAIKEKVKEGKKGKITVCTRTRGDFVEISIADTGAGIPENIRTRVFDPFFTTKEVGKGTGQGLSLAHAVVVKKHGGKIWFETEVGRGTTFFITLPVSPANRPQEA